MLAPIGPFANCAGSNWGFCMSIFLIGAIAAGIFVLFILIAISFRVLVADYRRQGQRSSAFGFPCRT
jgi:hypothetical protein